MRTEEKKKFHGYSLQPEYVVLPRSDVLQRQSSVSKDGVKDGLKMLKLGFTAVYLEMG